MLIDGRLYTIEEENVCYMLVAGDDMEKAGFRDAGERWKEYILWWSGKRDGVSGVGRKVDGIHEVVDEG